MGGTRLRPVGEGGHIIEDEGVPLAQQPALNFLGDGVIASDAPGKTNVTIPGGGVGGGGVWEKVAEVELTVAGTQIDIPISPAITLADVSEIKVVAKVRMAVDDQVRYEINNDTGLKYDSIGTEFTSGELGPDVIDDAGFGNFGSGINFLTTRPTYLVWYVAGLEPLAGLQGHIRESIGNQTFTDFLAAWNAVPPTTITNLRILTDGGQNFVIGSKATVYKLNLAGGGGGGNGHVIEDEGTPIAQQSNLNFVGAGVVAADIGGKSTITIPGLSPQSVKPIDIAVGLDYKWLHDQFFYDNITTFKQHGYQQDGISTPTFSASGGILTCQTPGTGSGVQASILTTQTFGIKNPLLESDVFFRGIVTNRDIGSPDQFSNVGLISGSTNGSLSIAAALDNMGDSIAFVVGNDDLFLRNWVAMTQVGIVRTLTDTGISSDLVKNLEFRSLANGDIAFLIDGVVVATHSTNIPVGTNLPFRITALRAVGGPVKMDLRGLTIGVRN